MRHSGEVCEVTERVLELEGLSDDGRVAVHSPLEFPFLRHRQLPETFQHTTVHFFLFEPVRVFIDGVNSRFSKE